MSVVKKGLNKEIQGKTVRSPYDPTSKGIVDGYSPYGTVIVRWLFIRGQDVSQEFPHCQEWPADHLIVIS